MVQHTHKKPPKDVNLRNRKEEKRYYNEKVRKELEEESSKEALDELAKLWEEYY